MDISQRKIISGKVEDIARRASCLMIHSGFEVEQKGSIENIVTSSDIAVQRFLHKELSSLMPGCGFICEEEDINDPDKEYTWIIDPIDGTANYARGIEFCCISIALKHADEVILGVVHSPWRDEMFSAVKGGGAFLNSKPVHVSGRSFQECFLFTALSTYRKELSGMCNAVIMETFHRCNDVRRYGSAAMELCHIALGEGDLYFEIRLQPWDYAAGLLILKEAGGSYGNLDGVHPRLDGPDVVLAANSRINFEQILGIAVRHIGTRPYED